MEKTSKVSIGSIYAKYGNLIILAIIIIAFASLAPSFMSVRNWLNILRQVSMMAIVAVGFTLLLISGGLDLSIGSQIAVMNVIVGVMFASGVPTLLAIVIGIAVTTLMGAFNGFVIVKSQVPAMMATIATLTAFRGIAFILCGGYPIYDIPPSIKYIGQGLVGGVIPVPIIIMLIVMIIGTIFLNKTYIGRYFYSIGSNTEAARLSGINVTKIRILAYALTGFACGVAGMIMLGRVSSAQPGAAMGFELDVLTSVVLGGVSVNGGRGTVPMAMLGVLVIGILTNGMTLVGLNDYWQQLVKGSVLLIVIVLDSMRVQRALKAK